MSVVGVAKGQHQKAKSMASRKVLESTSLKTSVHFRLWLRYLTDSNGSFTIFFEKIFVQIEMLCKMRVSWHFINSKSPSNLKSVHIKTWVCFSSTIYQNWLVSFNFFGGLKLTEVDFMVSCSKTSLFIVHMHCVKNEKWSIAENLLSVV